MQYEDNAIYLESGAGGILREDSIWNVELRKNRLYKIDLKERKIE